MEQKRMWAVNKAGKLFSLLCMLVIFLSISACQTTPSKKSEEVKRPGWLLSTPTRPGFIYGVGSAEVFGNNETSAVTRAKDIARVELIKQIKVDVSGVVEQETKEVTRGSETMFTQNLRSAVTSKVPEFTLSHVEQVDSYRSPDGSEVSVMVRFDVNRELASLQEKISGIDQQLADYGRQAVTTTASSLTTLRKLAPALILADQRAGLQVRMNELDPAGRTQPLLSNAQRDTVARIYQLISQLKVSVNADGKEDRSFKTRLISQLTSRGIAVSGDQRTDVQIVYALRLNEVKRDGAVFAITEGDVWIKDEHGRVVKAFQAKAKGGSSDATEARSRSLKKLSEQLGEVLLEVLFS